MQEDFFNRFNINIQKNSNYRRTQLDATRRMGMTAKSLKTLTISSSHKFWYARVLPHFTEQSSSDCGTPLACSGIWALLLQLPWCNSISSKREVDEMSGLWSSIASSHARHSVNCTLYNGFSLNPKEHPTFASNYITGDHHKHPEIQL